MTSAEPQELAYDEQIGHLTRQLEIARQKVAGLESELDWWKRGRELFGHPPNGSIGLATGSTKPTLAQGLFLIADEAFPEKIEWTASEMMAALRERGWMPTGKYAEHSVRTKLSNVAQPGGTFRR